MVAREFAIGRYWEQRYDAKPTWPITPNFTDNSLPMFGTFGYAIQAYERVRQYDPTGPLADASLMALGNAYFRQGEWEEAAQNYDTLRKEYPNSKYQMTAHLLDLQAKMRIYQGTAYDETPLKEAGKIAKQTLTQFGNKLGAEQRTRDPGTRPDHRRRGQSRLQTRRILRATQVLWRRSVVLQKRDRRLSRHGNGQAGQARMEEYRNEPDEPPKRFAWLTGMFK